MPFTFLAHQAPVIPLKTRWPRLFSGTALVVGSMAPDLHYFLFQTLDPRPSHSVIGQFYYCLPLTLAIILLLNRVVAAPLAAHLPDGGSFHLRDLRALAAPMSMQEWLRAADSALLGSFSHIFLDAFTHKRGAGMRWLPS